MKNSVWSMNYQSISLWDNMKTLNEFLTEGKVVEKDGIITITITKKQAEEVEYSFDTTEYPEKLGKLKGTKLTMTKEQAKNLGYRLTSDYDPSYGFESLSKAMTKSMYKLGQTISKYGK